MTDMIQSGWLDGGVRDRFPGPSIKGAPEIKNGLVDICRIYIVLEHGLPGAYAAGLWHWTWKKLDALTNRQEPVVRL